MNKKGQTLVIFIILIPLLLVFGAVIVDNSMIVYKNLNIKNITKDIIRINLKERELDDSEIKDIYKKNGIPTDNILIKRDISKISIQITYYTESIFGKLINIKSYEVSCSIIGYYENNKVIFK